MTNTNSIQRKVTHFFADYPEHRASKGAIIVFGNEDPPGVILLTSGTVGQYDIGANGQKVMLNIFRTHAFFPLSWAINHTPNEYFFEALEPITYRVAPPEPTIAFLRDNPDVLLDVLSRVFRGTDGLLRRMIYLMSGDARSRLILEILIACQRWGKTQPDGRTSVQLTGNDLATRTGLSRETVSRLLQKLKNEGIVELQRGHIAVRDLATLQHALSL